MTWSEVCEKEEVKKITEGFLYALFPDRLMFLKWPLDKNGAVFIEKTGEQELSETRLLECRIFNKDYEYRLARTDLGSAGEWKERLIDDADERYQDYFDEKQYLDIDDKKSKKVQEEGICAVTATGGGRYQLPVPEFKDAMLRIRNYLGYYEKTGQAYVKDWRMTGFGKEEAEDGRL